MRRIALLMLMLGLLALAPAAHAAYPSNFEILAANSDRGGRVDLLVIGPGNSPVSIFEEVGGERRPLTNVTTTAGIQVPDGRVLGSAIPRGITTWNCDRRDRRFVATTPGPNGTTLEAFSSVRTRSCRKRFTLSVPRKARKGGRIRVKVTDRFKLGDTDPRICVKQPKRGDSCKRLAMDGRSSASRTIKVSRKGVWKVGLRGPDQVLKRSVAVGEDPLPADAADPWVALYGDSMMAQLSIPIDDGLPVRVQVDDNLGGGVGLVDPTFDWIGRITQRTNALDPKVSVVLLGGSDGYPAPNPFVPGTTVACCGPAWVAGYKTVVEEALALLTRGGGRAIWVINPASAVPNRQPILDAVETAVRQAAAGIRGASVVDLGPVLSPGGVFAEQVGGVKVRADDGLHLTVAGADIAARSVLRAIGRVPVDKPPNDADNQVLRKCRTLTGKKKSVCAKRVRALVRCEKQKGAKKRACQKKARAIGRAE